MKQYPKIPGSKNCPTKPCIAFEKYDGSNIRIEFTPKHGFYKFGTRRRLFDKTDKYFKDAIPLFMDRYSELLSKIFKDHKRFRGVQRLYAFTEFFGKESFAGLHKDSDSTRQTILFDIWVDRFGILSPREFINIFSDEVPIARKVYEGKINHTFMENVRNGKYDGARDGEFDIFEGVVCKGGSGGRDIWMAKIKTNKYLAKLKEVYANNWQDYWE